MPMTDPFVNRFEVSVAGGALEVARAGAPPADADTVVVAVHGVASSHVVWRAHRLHQLAGHRDETAARRRGVNVGPPLAHRYPAAVSSFDMLTAQGHRTEKSEAGAAGPAPSSRLVAREKKPTAQVTRIP